jgi:hypothetical protein
MWLLLLGFSRWHAICRNSWHAAGLGEPKAVQHESSAWEGGAFVKGSKPWKMPL